jgi:hypothetical protein
MQESGCNPNTIGGAGEQGVMQITEEKCAGRSPAECRELVRSPRFASGSLGLLNECTGIQDFNIGTGANYFATQLKAHGGNVVETVGGYNGYFKGMTLYDATKDAKTSCCRCQNNLD